MEVMRRVLPDWAVAVLATPEMGQGSLPPEEAVFIKQAVPKRRREFTAGRTCARRALARLGIVGHALSADADRVPRWPDAVVGSISHCEGCCGAVVARREHALGIGFDVEKADPLREPLIPLVCSAVELAHQRTLPDAQGLDWCKLAFSAKESFYKCYFPLTRFRLDFRDVELRFAAESGDFVARLVSESAPAAAGLRALRGRFACDGRHVFTTVTIPAPDAPTRWEDPTER